MRARQLRALVEKNRRWLGCGGLPWGARLGYYPALAAAAVRDLRGAGGGAVEYLGRPFVYDNPHVPFLLLGYPDEVLGRVVANAGGPIRRVLDVGGNVGQFARTFAELVPGVERLDVLEPNPTVLPLLEANTAHLPVVRCFGVGVGPAGPGRLHVTPGRSGIGSLVAENARYRPDSPLVAQDVPLVADVGALTGWRDYDLLKVDVEGYELEALAALEGVTFRWLFLEVTGRAKARAWRHSDLHALLARRFGPYDVRYQSEGGADATVFEVLLERVAAG